VDAIFNLACPASPIHYQVDPVRTIQANVLGVTNGGTGRFQLRQIAQIIARNRSAPYATPRGPPPPLVSLSPESEEAPPRNPLLSPQKVSGTDFAVPISPISPISDFYFSRIPRSQATAATPPSLGRPMTCPMTPPTRGPPGTGRAGPPLALARTSAVPSAGRPPPAATARRARCGSDPRGRNRSTARHRLLSFLYCSFVVARGARWLDRLRQKQRSPPAADKLARPRRVRWTRAATGWERRSPGRRHTTSRPRRGEGRRGLTVWKAGGARTCAGRAAGPIARGAADWL
jgi:hypothetical protein